MSFRRSQLALAAAVAVSSLGVAQSMVRAADAGSELSLSPLYASATGAAVTPGGTVVSPVTGAPAAHAPLMMLLDQAGVGQSLDAARINIYGHVEAGYTYNFDNPAKNLNLGRVFDLQNDRVQVNQLDLNVERVVDLTSHQFDIGGRIEMLYGTDAQFIHANGLLDHESGEYQFDLPQAYLDLAIPVGSGLRLRVGKFLFFKQIDPNASVFFSHSYTFGGALPFTLTGVTGMYNFGDQLSVEGGVSRGWGQSIDDNNGSIDGLVRVRYNWSDRTNITVAAITGPELDKDDSHYRTAVDLTVSHAMTDQLTLLLDAVYGTQAGGSPSGSNANWYGVSGYAVYRINEYLALGARGEWYRDEEGFTTAVAQNLYEATIGATITPFPNDPVGANLKLRPEVRYDYSSQNFFDGLTRHDQTTFAIDAIFNF